MPVKSKAQSRFLNWKFGHKWVKKHHFAGKTGDLPEKKPEDEKDKKEKRKEEMTTSVNVGGGPASKPPNRVQRTKMGGTWDPKAEKARAELNKPRRTKMGGTWDPKAEREKAEKKRKDEAALQRVMKMVYAEEARLRKN